MVETQPHQAGLYQILFWEVQTDGKIVIEVLWYLGSLVGMAGRKERERTIGICWILFQQVIEQVVQEQENGDLGELFQSCQMGMGWSQVCDKTLLHLPHYFHRLYW